MRSWFLSLGLAAFAAGCGGADAAAEDSADVTQSSASYYVAVSVQKGGGDLGDLTKVQLADRAKTKCDDGTMRSSCAVALDFSSLKLNDASEQNLLKEFQAKHAIVKGKIVAPTNVKPTVPAVAVLKVSAAWTGVVDATKKSSDQFFLAYDKIQSELCGQKSNCPRFTLHPVNASGTQSDLSVIDVDLTKVKGATSSEIKQGEDRMDIGAAGLLVLGSTYYGNGWGDIAPTNFFLPAKNLKKGLGQTCGGFAGLVCPSGLVCAMSGPSYPDKSGTCEEPSPVN